MRFHGGMGKTRNVIDFSVNVNPLGVPLELEESIAECCVERKTYTMYPDYSYRELRRAIAYFYGGLEPQNIIPFNGAAEALNTAIIALKPRTLVTVSPGYGDMDYELLCRSLRIKCVHYVMRDRGEYFVLDINELLREVTSRAKPVLVMSNPNNPTGTVIPAQELLGLAENLEDKAYIIVDEAYAELSPNYTGVLGNQSYDNIIVVRSFTKIFGVPGLRIGFLYSSSRTILGRIEDIRQPWNVNAIAECSLKKVLIEHRDKLWKYISGVQAFITVEREDMAGKLRALGYHVYESHANFLLLRHDWIDSMELYRSLLRKRILVRPAHTFYGLTRHHTRVSVRRKWENELLVKALAETRRER